MNGIKRTARRAGMAAAFIALFLSAAGCFETPWAPTSQGEVKFRASTHYLSGWVKAGTKTLYTGDRRTGYEDLYWVTGDSVKVHCEECVGPDPTQKWGLYKVRLSGGTPSKVAEALDADHNNRLMWNADLSKEHHYFAAYPTEVDFVGPAPTQPSLMTMTYDVPAVQRTSGASTLEVTSTNGTKRSVTEYAPDMKLIPMAAYEKVMPDTLIGSVALFFRPMVTSLRVELMADDELTNDKKLTMLKLKPTKTPGITPSLLAGTYSVTVGDGQNAVFNDPAAVKQDIEGKTTGYLLETINGGRDSVCIIPAPNEGGVKLDEKGSSGSKYTAFTFVMCPVNAEDLTLELTFGGTYNADKTNVIGGVTRSLALKDNGSSVSFPAMKKSYLDGVSIKQMTWGYPTDPYNPGSGFGDADFEFEITPRKTTMWTGENFYLYASSKDASAENSVTVSPSLPWPGIVTLPSTTQQSLASPNDSRSWRVVCGDAAGTTKIAVTAERLGIPKGDTCAVTVRKLEDLTITNAGTSEPPTGTPENQVRVYTLTTSLTKDTILIPKVLYHDGTNSGQVWNGGVDSWNILSGSDVVDLSNGIVTPKKGGTAVVECTIKKGSGSGQVIRTARCTVEVIPGAAGTEGYGKGNTTGF